MSSVDWRRHVDHSHRVVAKKWAPYGEEDERFLALALAGEVGELANVIKKRWRGDGDPDFHAKVRDEIADVRNLELLARTFGVNVDLACVEKVGKLYARWPEAGEGAPE